MKAPTGTTTLAAVIGAPVGHSLSPVILNAAFAEAGLDWVYVALEVAEGRGADAIHAVRVLGLGGLSVTMPHKAAVLPALDEVSPEAERLGAVNCVVRRDDRLVGHNTDGAGFIGGLHHDAGIAVEGRSCIVFGAGGAGRAVVAALAEAGAAEVAVCNRSTDRAEAAVALAGSVGRRVDVDAVGEYDVVVNATSVGMGGGAEYPFAVDRLRAGQVVSDLIYLPLETPLVAEARARGIEAHNGVSMLVHQAAEAFQLWTDVAAPVDAMSTAARAAIAAR